MKRKNLLRALFVAGLLGTAAVLGLQSEWAGEKVCAQARLRIPQATGMQVRIGHCALEPLDLGVELRQVAVTLPGASEPSVEAERAEVHLDLFHALFGTLRVSHLEVARPRVKLNLRDFELPESKAPRTRDGTCALTRALQEIDVHRLIVSDGQVDLLLPDARSLELRALNVSAHGWRGATAIRFSEAGGKLSFEGGVLPLEKVLVSGQLDARKGSAELAKVELVGGQLSVIGHGMIQDLCDPELNLEANAGVPIDLLVALGKPKGVKASGYLTVNALLTGKLASPTAHVEVDVSDFAASLSGQSVEPRDLSASIDLHDGKLELTQLYWPLGEGYGKVSAEITPKGNWPLVVNVEGKAIPFGELMNRLPLKHPWVDASCSVKARLTGHLLPTPALSGPTSVDIDDFHVRTRAWDGPATPDDEVVQLAHAHIDTEFGFTPERVKLTHAKLTGAGGEVDAEALLYTDPKRGIELSAELAGVDLTQLGDIVGMPWAGVVGGHVHITGPYGTQTIDGALNVKDFSFAGVHLGEVAGPLRFDPSFVLSMPSMVATKGKTTYRGHGALDFSHGSPLAGGVATVENGRVEDFLEVLHDVHWAFAMFRGEMTGRVSGTIKLAKGPVMAPTSDFALQLRGLDVWGRPMGDADFKMHTQDGDSLTVAPMHLRGAAGDYTFAGRQQVGGALRYTLTAKGVPAAVIAAPELADWDLTGTLSGSATIAGTQAQPEIRGDVSGQDLTLFGLPLGQGHVKAVGTGDSMQITGPVGDDVALFARMRWTGRLPVDATFTFNVNDLFQYVPTSPEWNDVGGQVKGTLKVHGDMTDARSYVGTYLFPTVVFQKGDYVERNTQPVRLDFQGDDYDLRSFSFADRTGADRSGTGFSISGTREGARRALNLEVKGSLDARLLATLSRQIESVGGRVDLAASIGGTQDKPAMVGSAQLTRGRIALRDHPLTVQGLSGRIEFSQSSIEIPSLEGTLNRGRMVLSGSVGLAHFKPASADLRLLLDDAQVQLPGLPETTVSGELELTGKTADPLLSGALSIVRLRYSDDLNLEKLVGSLTRKKLSAQTFTKRPRVVRFADLTIHLDGDVRVDNNLLKTRLQGELNVLGDDAHPLLRGDIEGAEGGRAFFRGNEFLLDQLLVSFRDTEKITPEFDIHATTEARDYKVFLHAYGTPDENHVLLTSQPELQQSDLVTLLTLGFTSQDRSSSGSGATLGAAAEALYSISGLDQQVQRFIPKNKLLKDPSFRFTTTYSQALGSMQPTAEIEGKILVDQMRLRLQEPVVAGGRGFKMQGEYRFSDTGSIEGQLDRDNSDYNFPDVGLDLKLRWEMK